MSSPSTVPPSPAGPRSVAEVLDALLREPGRPRLTWYGGDGERVELSGAVLVNWVNKTTNLLVEEFDAGPGTRVLLDLPGHWRTVVWALAVWRAGACVVTADAESADSRQAPDVVVTDRPERHEGTDELVAVALPALARGFAGPLPAGAIDAAAAVMTHGDQLGWVPPSEGDATALVAAAGSVTHADLLVADGTPGSRILVEAPNPAAAAGALSHLIAGHSLVLVSRRQAEELTTDPERRARLVSSERIDADQLKQLRPQQMSSLPRGGAPE